MIASIYKIIACHLLGDYPLQSDFLAETKDENWYHLIVHCMLYSVPFAVAFGIDWRLIPLIGSHIVIDALEARYQKIGYVADQILHYCIAVVLYVLIGGNA